MSFFGTLEKIGGDIYHAAAGTFDAVTGNEAGAIQNAGSIVNSFAGHKKPTLVSTRNNNLPSAITGSTMAVPGSPSIYQNSMAILPSGGSSVFQQAGVTSTLLNSTTAVQFFQWLANHNWQGTWDYFTTIISHPFSDWGQTLQDLYNSWIAGGAGNGVTSGSNLPALPSAPGGAAGGGDVVAPIKKIRYEAPPGYVIVHHQGKVYAVRREVAMHTKKANGKPLWRPQPKPYVTHKQYKAVQEAKKFEKKVHKMAEDLGFKMEKKGMRKAPARKKEPEIIIKEVDRR